MAILQPNQLPAGEEQKAEDNDPTDGSKESDPEPEDTQAKPEQDTFDPDIEIR